VDQAARGGGGGGGFGVLAPTEAARGARGGWQFCNDWGLRAAVLAIPLVCLLVGAWGLTWLSVFEGIFSYRVAQAIVYGGPSLCRSVNS
jgi:hypothetical protein